jgi:hypothetical protein
LCHSNNLNATLSNPGLVNALLSLHACGLTVLNLEANNIAGSIPDAFALLVNLKVLNLGEHFGKGHKSQAAACCSSNALRWVQQQRQQPAVGLSATTVGNCWR